MPAYGRLSMDQVVYWFTFIFAGLAVTITLVTMVRVSSLEESSYYDQENRYFGPTKTLTLVTTLGDIHISLARSAAPVTVNNFLQMAQSGFYDQTKFHRIVSGLLIQGGDPLSREDDRDLYGTGGPGYVYEDENLGAKFQRGSVAMANQGRPKTNGSQFFIVVSDTAPKLDGKYTIFGQVETGMDVVDKINSVKLDAKGVPIEPIYLVRVQFDR
jgi:peptidyl-prolyl cis-trans isomerase B (cyclophilin B)